MTAFDYSRSAATFDRLITRFGQAGTLRQRGAKTGTKTKPTFAADVNRAVKFAVVDFQAKEIDGTRILATDKKVLLAKGSLTVSPVAEDELIEAGGQKLKVVHVKTLKPATTVIGYIVQARA